MRKLVSVFVVVFIFLHFNAFAQQYTIKGKVIDANTSEALPFSSVYIQNTTYGVSTDFDGNFEITIPKTYDTLTISSVGYVNQKLYIPSLKLSDSILIQLKIDESTPEVLILPGENRAYAILRNINKYKEQHTKEKLDFMEYNSLTYSELYINNISDKMRSRKVMREIGGLLDTTTQLKDNEGNPIVPIFMSETYSKNYFRSNPKTKKEYIEATRISGVGVENGSVVSQLMGSTFQDYNFYKNYVSVLNKDFISPLSDQWRLFYEYELIDSIPNDKNDTIYEIKFWPRQPQDLTFKGTMWIAKSTYTLNKIQATVDKSANLNFIDQVYLEQELELDSSTQVSLPKNILIELDIEDITNNTPSLIGKYRSNYLNYNLNKPIDSKNLDIRVEVSDSASYRDESYWNNINTDSVSTAHVSSISANINAVKKLPTVKSYVEIIDLLVNGYKSVGIVDIGPYIYSYANNNIEGSRFQLGLKTNYKFSKRITLAGYGAYGTKDDVFKYNVRVNYLIDRKPWTEVGVQYTYDIDQVGVPSSKLENNNLFFGVTRWRKLRGPYYTQDFKANISRDLNRYLNFKIQYHYNTFNPAYPFSYQGENDATMLQTFTNSEFVFNLHLNKDEVFIINENERISLGSKIWPILDVKYQLGVKGMLGSEFEYHQLHVQLKHSVRMFVFGRTNYRINAGKIFNTLPYPLLENHIGNSSWFYTTAAFNMMNFFEFSSDQYASIKIKHDFEGLFFNRIPLIKKLKWRFFGTANFLVGSMTEANKSAIYNQTVTNAPKISTLRVDKPYIELGYGIENIFRFIRIDAIHRMSYLDDTKTNKFGIKISMQFTL